MNELLQRYASVSLSASLLTMALLLLRPLYKQRFGKQWQYYVWLIVILRFLIPWNPVNGQIGSFIYKVREEIQTDTVEPLSDENMSTDAKERNDKETNMDMINATYVSETGEEDTKSAWNQEIQKKIPWILQNLWIFWLTPAFVLFIRKVTIYQSFLKFLKAGSVPVDDMGRLEMLGKVMEQNHVQCPVGLYTNSLTASVIMTGFFHPVVILTKEELSDADFYYTIWHEVTHYRRGDMFYKWLVQLTVCLHWFNPFVYVLAHETDRLCELSCDEAVTKKLNADEKRAYGDMLLRAMQAGGSYKNDVASVTLYGGKDLLKERLGAIMNEKKKSAWISVLAAVFAAALAYGGIAAGACMQPAAAANAGNPDRLFYDKTIEKDGCFYLLCEGAKEQEIPSGSVTDGCVNITLVKKDEYISIGPFENVKKLVRDANILVNDMLKEKSVTRAEAELLKKAAENIQEDILKVRISRTSLSLAKGQTAALKLDGTNKRAAWYSKNEKVAAVSKNGKVTAKKEGKAEICAALYNQTYSCIVRVSASTKKQNAALKGTEQDIYELHGIKKKNGAYFYQGSRIRIFMDLRADQSFVNFNYDETGTVDIRLQRTQDIADASEASVRYLTKSEAEEIINDIRDTDDADSRETQAVQKQPDLKISRLRKEELPAEALETVGTCKDRIWYVIEDAGVRYIYYNGLPNQYAFKPQFSGQKAMIKIVDMKSSGENYVLLRVRENVPLSIRYRGKKVAVTRIKI